MKNLGFTLDYHLTMNAHVSDIARTCYFELRHLAYIRRFQTSTATDTLGDCSFSFAFSFVWNSIPNDVRYDPSLSSFKSRLKTYLFRLVYKD